MEIKIAKGIIRDTAEELIENKKKRTSNVEEIETYSKNIMDFYNNFEDLMVSKNLTCEQCFIFVIDEMLSY